MPEPTISEPTFSGPVIERLDPAGFERHLDRLAEILHACVHGGASVNFILPFPIEESRAFWTTKVRPALLDRSRVLLVVHVGDDVAGTVQLDLAQQPNQTHRAEVAKLLVHPDFRSRGLARLLMSALEKEARRLGRSLLTLDTTTGSNAEPLYRSLGYETAGVIPGFSRAPLEDRYEATTYMYKTVR